MEKEQKEFCKKYQLTSEEFFGKEKIYGRILFNGATVIPSGFSPIIVGDLYLKEVLFLPENFQAKITGFLFLESALMIPRGFHPEIGGDFLAPKVERVGANFSPKIGKNLSIANLKNIDNNFSPVVGGYTQLGEDIITKRESYYGQILANGKTVKTKETAKFWQFENFVKINKTFGEIWRGDTNSVIRLVDFSSFELSFFIFDEMNNEKRITGNFKNIIKIKPNVFLVIWDIFETSYIVGNGAGLFCHTASENDLFFPNDDEGDKHISLDDIIDFG